MVKKNKTPKTPKTPKTIIIPQLEVVKPDIKVKLSMSDKLFIEQNMKNKSVGVLATSIDKPVSLIEEYIRGLSQQKQIERYLDIIEENMKSGDHMKKQSGTIMLTEISSEISDANRFMNNSPIKNKNDRIHKMKRS
jgi:hypothetical protein